MKQIIRAHDKEMCGIYYKIGGRNRGGLLLLSYYVKL